MTDLARHLGQLGAWVRLHYVYPYPHVDRVIPLMADGLVLPYLDIPFQHAAPSVLRAMKRPANDAKVLDRIAKWRAIAPDITIRSTFVVGFPGETEADFDYLLQWLDEAQLDRVGAFRFEPVAGASANDLPDHVPEEVKEERYARLMDKCAASRPRSSTPRSAARWMSSSTWPTTKVAPPVARRPTPRRSTARSICAMPTASSPAMSSRSRSRMPTSMTCSACRWPERRTATPKTWRLSIH
jgi:hypothetical protein